MPIWIHIFAAVVVGALIVPVQIQKPNDQPTQNSINRQWHTHTLKQTVEQNAFFFISFHILLNCRSKRGRRRQREGMKEGEKYAFDRMVLHAKMFERDKTESSWLLGLESWIFSLDAAAFSAYLLACCRI